ncbi:hypothetical protein [Neptunomonas marina]|uniref:DUF481 domain-containing protein n=1 Tax=Neptunomonas marina TaxID=1815562 RepID=A0A437QAT9_9GAMM|nr:hypothetical protein [Neptunomonas marina]RVU31651.1 hypothetical protein EOE65_06655 [Neptunomonas marina]
MKRANTATAAALMVCSHLAVAGEWELKTDATYRDGARLDQTTYEADGSFDKRKIKEKHSKEFETQLVHYWLYQDDLKWGVRVGHRYKTQRDRELQLKKSGKVKKDKSRTEIDRTTYLGLTGEAKVYQQLGADVWIASFYYDHYLQREYSAHRLGKDANDRRGSVSGYEWQARLYAEYSTPWPSIFVLPYVQFKEERLGLWYNSARDKVEEAERELQYEAGMSLSWVMPAPGWELNIGGYWQRERDAERRENESRWTWQDDESGVARIVLEYEAPMPGFEFEARFEETLRGPEEGKQRFNVELSYEF